MQTTNRPTRSHPAWQKTDMLTGTSRWAVELQKTR